MIGLNKINFPHLRKATEFLKDKFLDYSDNSISLPGELKFFIFSSSFFDSDYYLVFPYLFKKAFGENDHIARKICFSGFLYFRYLLCLDDLTDKDSDSTKGANEAIIHIKSHVFHEEALKILGHHFGRNPLFWDLWNKRNAEFLSGILMDKEYDPNMKLEAYKKLAIYKCSFSKVAADAYYARRPITAPLHAALITSIEYFSIARCIQDDLEDFKKDAVYKKNNLGHILLNQWFIQNDKKFADYPPETLEKYLFISEVADDMLSLSKDYYQRSIDVLNDYSDDLTAYIRVIETLRNGINFLKVNINAYRISTYLTKMPGQKQLKEYGLEDAIRSSENYIRSMQNANGSWYEISNMQGLSNVWSTGFIASFLDPQSDCLQRASDFLLANRQNGLWGYNTDWVYDFDSTTCALFTLSRNNYPVGEDLPNWFKGQTDEGGFRTYIDNDHVLRGNLGLENKKDVKGWTNSHLCVSALAYFFLKQLPEQDPFSGGIDLLRSYILKNRNAKGVWQPYWWTSYLYPTCYIIQGLLLEKEDFSAEIDKALSAIVHQQNKDGSFSCDVLKQPSVFYTALVLSTLCSSPVYYRLYEKNVTAMKDWLLKRQYENGSFAGSDFLVIPNPNTTRWSASRNTFTINHSGGGNTITGEIASLFSTTASLNALTKYKGVAHNTNYHEN